jgi:hypothetical protein
MADHGDGKSIIDSLSSSGGIWTVFAAAIGAILTGFFNLFRRPPKTEAGEQLRLALEHIKLLMDWQADAIKRMDAMANEIDDLKQRLGVCRESKAEA